MYEVTIYTDGACRGNPGPGGIGIILESGKRRKEISKGYRKTTNNRMELLAAITGLSSLKKKCSVKLFSDSNYLVESMENGWVQRWAANQWKKKENRDLWIELLKLCSQHQVKFIWVKGHADNPYNNRCDQLAVDAAKQEILDVDEGYEEKLRRQDSQTNLF
jgi:ribonuclease HI